MKVEKLEHNNKKSFIGPLRLALSVLYTLCMLKWLKMHFEERGVGKGEREIVIKNILEEMALG
jgi:hypothetical protein